MAERFLLAGREAEWMYMGGLGMRDTGTEAVRSG